MGAEQSTPEQAPPVSVGASNNANGTHPRALVVCGPSCVGRKSLIKLLLERNPGKYDLCVSHTSRPPGPGDVPGSTYYFVSREDFESGVQAKQFLEYATINGHYYGTSRKAVEDVLAGGKVAILEIDIQGARKLRAAALGGIFVFLAPPTLEELHRRMRQRGRDSEEDMLRRMRVAKAEINSVNEKGLFDYLLLNDELETCYQELLRVAKRAAQGLGPEPGMMPEQVLLEANASMEITAMLGRPGSPNVSAAGSMRSTSSLYPPTHTSSRPAVAAAAGGSAASPSTSPGARTALGAAAKAGGAVGASGGGAVRSPRTGNSSSSSSSGPAGGAPAHGVAATQLRAVSSPAAPAQGVGPAAAAAAAAGFMGQGLAKWKGKVALVTGASSGIGWAVCETLGRAGFRVVAAARRRDRLEALQQHMLSPGVGMAPVDFLPVVCDITKEPEVAALPRIVAKRWPDSGIDVLVNNAGLSRNNASLFEGATASWLEMLSTNVLGNAMATREVLQDMQRRGSWGHIINMVGLSGHRIPDATSGGTFFAATKFAVKALTEGLRQEARGRGVPLRVSGISPGLVETEFFTVRAFGDKAAAQQVTSSMKCLQPSDIAEAILWCLAAPEHMEVNDIIVRPSEQLI